MEFQWKLYQWKHFIENISNGFKVAASQLLQYSNVSLGYASNRRGVFRTFSIFEQQIADSTFSQMLHRIRLTSPIFRTFLNKYSMGKAGRMSAGRARKREREFEASPSEWAQRRRGYSGFQLYPELRTPFLQSNEIFFRHFSVVVRQIVFRYLHSVHRRDALARTFVKCKILSPIQHFFRQWR